MLRLFAAMLVLLAGCDRVVAIEGLDGARGSPGAAGAPGPPGPQGTPAALPGERLVPLYFQAEDGARAASGLWLDTERGETCLFQEVSEEWRCLPRFRSQAALTAWAEPSCAGAHASAVTKPGYIFETSTGVLYQLGGALSKAYEIQDGACVESPPGDLFMWTEVSPAVFVGATLGE